MRRRGASRLIPWRLMVEVEILSCGFSLRIYENMKAFVL
jgi:hypothetical protein